MSEVTERMPNQIVPVVQIQMVPQKKEETHSKDVLDFDIQPHLWACIHMTEAIEWKSAMNGTNCPKWMLSKMVGKISAKIT